MSTPQDSIAPPDRTPSSPTVVTGWSPAVQAVKALRTWLAGLSPAGATVHDTAWVTITPAAGYAGVYQYRRIGRGVEVRWQCTTSIAAGAFINPLFILPPSAPRPASSVPASVYGAFAHPLTALLDAGGVLYIRNNHTGAAATHNGSAFYWAD